MDALSPQDRLILEEARMLREDFLQQDAMSDTDAYCPSEKQFQLLRLILSYYDMGREALAKGANMNALFSIPARDNIGRAKNESNYQKAFAEIESEMRAQISELIAKGGEQL